MNQADTWQLDNIHTCDSKYIALPLYLAEPYLDNRKQPHIVVRGGYNTGDGSVNSFWLYSSINIYTIKYFIGPPPFDWWFEQVEFIIYGEGHESNYFYRKQLSPIIIDHILSYL